jgi:hypothetical protein
MDVAWNAGSVLDWHSESLLLLMTAMQPTFRFNV